MKKNIRFVLLVALAACNLSLQTTPTPQTFQTRQTVKAAQTVKAPRVPKPLKLETIISRLMIEQGRQAVANPIHLTNHQNRPCQSIDTLISSSGAPVTCGPAYATLRTILARQPLFKKYPVTLHQATNENGNIIACATKTSIILYPLFQRQCDGSKLFTLYHEVQHHRYNDCNHLLDIKLDNKNHLANLKPTSKVKSILANSTIDLSNKEMLSLLEENDYCIQTFIRRFQEKRADTQAMQTMRCPCCIKEAITSSRSNECTINPKGYLRTWQFHSRILKLEKQGKTCLHHHKNGGQIDTSINDSSTLADRLMIINKKTLPSHPQKTNTDPKSNA